MIIGTTGPTVFNEEIKSLVQDYYKAIPLYINQDTPEGLDWVVNNIQGLILSGGRDIHPITYDEEITNNDCLSSFDFLRDKREIYLIKKCFEKNVPVLGICRGHQLLGIYHKLYFLKDITGSQICHSPSSSKIETDELPCHKVYCVDKFKDEFFNVEYCNSYHHQGLHFFDKQKDIEYYTDRGVEVIGYAYTQYKEGNKSDHKIIELMRGLNNRWISMQWHAEEKTTDKPNKIVLDKFREMLG